MPAGIGTFGHLLIGRARHDQCKYPEGAMDLIVRFYASTVLYVLSIVGAATFGLVVRVPCSRET
jgi:hypothetical protein